jgi:2-polyprenyl-3-methyl-5-hydroxy-6-metoxy-1,4-benzoquinol methylase
MDKIYQENVIHYDSSSDGSYVYNESHIKRVDIVIDLIKKSLKSGVSPKVLSLGCASGIIEERIMKEVGCEMYGVDGSPVCLEIAQTKGIVVQAANIEESLPYGDESFDIVWAGEIIEHIFDTEAFLNEIRRVLKKDGVVILSTPNLASLSDRFKFLFGYSPKHVNPLHPHYSLHIRPFTLRGLQNVLINSNFSINDSRTNIIEILIKGQVIWKSYTLANLLPGFGGTLIVRATKK